MPITPQYAPNTLSFTTIISRFVNRLSTKLSVAESVIRVCAAPDANMSEYLAEQGLVLRVRPPAPKPDSGGDRWAYMVDRVIDVFVVTSSLRDPGGRNDIAINDHILREESVVDALLTQPPDSQTIIPVITKWVPGGQEIMRQVKTDPSLYVSVLPFLVTYRQRLTVNRE